MSELDNLTAEIERLLKDVHGNYSLDEWRYAYRKIVRSGGMKILEVFPEIILGPVYSVGAGQPPPYRPSTAINELLCIVLGNCPPQQT
jgi:hypothetical protein